jgi:hypothetical protein
MLIPPVPNAMAEREGSMIFEGPQEMARVANPEPPEGSTACALSNNLPWQELPNSLARIHAFLSKQVALNNRVLEKGDRVAACSAERADFLVGFDHSKNIFVALGLGGHTWETLETR